MTVNELVDAVVLAIHNEFNGIYPIYKDSVKQGLEEPCFFVFCLNPTINPDLGDRYIRTNLFSVQYMDVNYSSRFDVMERLFNCLEMIEVNGKTFRGTDFSAETVDDVLHFTFHYDVFEYRITDVDDMERLELETRDKVI